MCTYSSCIQVYNLDYNVHLASCASLLESIDYHASIPSCSAVLTDIHNKAIEFTMQK